MTVRMEVTPNEIPRIFADLGVTRGLDPDDPGRLRLFITGKPGSGKTALAASISDSLLVDFDCAAQNAVGARALRVPVRTFDHWNNLYAALLKAAQENRRPVSRVTLDSADGWLLMEELQLCKELSDESRGRIVTHIGDYGKDGAGYNRLYRRCFGRLNELYHNGYGWSLVAHLSEKQVTIEIGGETKDVTRIRPSIYPGFVKLTVPECDYHLTTYSVETKEAEYAVKTIEGVEKKIKIGEREVTKFYLRTIGENDEKKRLALPRKMELPAIGGWDVFVSEYAKAREVAMAQEEASKCQTK